MKIKAILITVIILLLILPSCSSYNSPGSAMTSEDDRASLTKVKDIEDPVKSEAIRAQVSLAGVFYSQVGYFYSYYGRFPSSFEEWRDSGFLSFTPWSGNALVPTQHFSRPLSVEDDPYGSFHYESTSPDECMVEFVFEIRQEVKVLSFKLNGEEMVSSAYRPDASYFEAKADAFHSFFDLMCAQKLIGYGSTEPAPTSLTALAKDYVSLVPEGFRNPPSTVIEGSFEFGIDVSNNKPYYFSDQQDSRFLNPTTPAEQVSLNRVVMFSSDLLNAGFPGLFN